MNTWNKNSVAELFAQPLFDLILQAQAIHRENFPANEVQLCSLLNIKTGGCPENCGYCNQSAHFKTGIKKEKLFEPEKIVQAAKEAKELGATRFCIAAAWRSPPKREMEQLVTTIKEIKALGLESCATLGMLNAEQAQQLAAAGLDFYNHNLDTSPEYYDKVVTTRTYQERLDTLCEVSNAGMRICCGVILGLGENRNDRISFLLQLTQLSQVPESIPINTLVQIPNTPLGKQNPVDSFECVRMVAATRIMFPQSKVRLCGGRLNMNEEMQALCFMAGANSIFYGGRMLTTNNNEQDDDKSLFARLGINQSMDSFSKINM